MIIAGLTASGRTEIEDIRYTERGYEDIVGKLAAVGADIHRYTCDEDPLKSSQNA